MPILDGNGLFREPRIEAAGDICYSVCRHPITVPGKHLVTGLLVCRYLQQYRHSNAETVVNEIHQMYNIPTIGIHHYWK